MGKQAVLLLAHGTPETVEQIPEYLRNVVSGRPLPQHVLEEIQHRYALIGRSPLTELTLEHARLVEQELAAAGRAVKVYVGMRNWRPYIPDVVKQMHADGVEEAAVLCLAPQNSRTSVGLYKRAVEAEAGNLRIDFTEGWADHPLLADAFAERLRAALGKLKAETGENVPVLFTAHSVPCRTVQTPAAGAEGGPRLWPAGQGPDPYPADAKHTAELVAARVPEIARWWFAFQSQGVSGGPWIGPTVEETLDSIAAEGVKTVMLQPIGFLCDHVEILYDVDIAFKQYAEKKGIRLERPESLNGSAALAKAVAELTGQGLARLR
ncbi:MAG: ferrochelatase [Rhodoferax sp.]|nr:ferrochelatase [Rhodoferax sp.]